MTDESYRCYHFSLSRTAPEQGGPLAVTRLLRALADELEGIDGLADEDILNVVLTSEVTIDGKLEMVATVYYALDDRPDVT